MSSSELREDVTFVAHGAPSQTPTGIVGDAINGVIGLDRLGASAPACVLYRQLGITPDAVAAAVLIRMPGQVG
jgi:transketolase